MPQGRSPAPARGALFFSVSMFLLFSAGAMLQSTLGVPGIFVTQLTLFLGLALWFGVSLEKQPIAQVFRLRPLSAHGVAKSAILGVATWALVQLVNFLISWLVTVAGGKLPQLYTDLATSGFVLALVSRALLPALCEEMAYRGYMLYSFNGLDERKAVLLTGLLFGAMHLSLIRLLPLALLGTIFALAVRRSGSIFPAMIMHFLNNTIALILTFFVKLPGDSTMGGLAVPFLLVGIGMLGAAAFALARSFGPADVAAEAADGAPAGAERAEAMATSEAVAMPKAAGLGASLLPGAVLYLYGVAGEILRVFVR